MTAKKLDWQKVCDQTLEATIGKQSFSITKAGKTYILHYDTARWFGSVRKIATLADAMSEADRLANGGEPK